MEQTPNCMVEYVDEQGAVVFVDQFYDPALDENSPLTQEMKRSGRWPGPHQAYGCGRPIRP